MLFLSSLSYILIILIITIYLIASTDNTARFTLKILIGL